MKTFTSLLFVLGCGTEHHHTPDRTPPQPSSCTVSPEGLLSCTDGTKYLIHDGRDGAPGSSIKGDKGDPGVATVGPSGRDGATGETGSTGAAGRDGVDGKDGVDATPVTWISPCPDRGPFPEVFLRLPDGSVLAHWSGGGSNEHFVVLTPGEYITTDGLATCHVHVSADLQVTWNG